MSDTDTRMTPEQILAECNTSVQFVWLLTQHGYRIVHPDDVPTVIPEGERPASTGALEHLWDACRDFIFGHRRCLTLTPPTQT